jgi:hypothetical protein
VILHFAVKTCLQLWIADWRINAFRENIVGVVSRDCKSSLNVYLLLNHRNVVMQSFANPFAASGSTHKALTGR